MSRAKTFPYLLKNKAICFPNQVWAVDITYILMKRGAYVPDGGHRLA
jgi:putative transposase